MDEEKEEEEEEEREEGEEDSSRQEPRDGLLECTTVGNATGTQPAHLHGEDPKKKSVIGTLEDGEKDDGGGGRARQGSRFLRPTV